MVTRRVRQIQIRFLAHLLHRKRMATLSSISITSSSSSSSNSSSSSSDWFQKRRDERRKIRIMILDEMINSHRRRMEASSDSSSSSSSGGGIYNREEITSKYNIIKLIGSGAYSDVYKASRISDGVFVALKEIHDYQSAFREIEMLKMLKGCENVVEYYEYFYDEDEDEDVVIVLEYFVTDLASVISDAKKRREESVVFSVEEIKGWMVQILEGVDECQKRNVVHRDLKPSNLLISDDGVLKLADFGQARILLKPGACSSMNDVRHNQQNYLSEDQGNNNGREQLFRNLVEQRAKYPTADDMEAYEGGGDNDGPLTSFVGTRWFRAPELLYGSSNYGIETDLWSLGCIFAELLRLEPIFPGTSEMDQLARIFDVLGNLTEENYPGCSNLPIYETILFNKREKPIGIEGCLPGRSPDEILLVKKLLCFDPTKRVTVMELLEDKYFNEEPFPAGTYELRVPKTRCVVPVEDSPGDGNNDEETSSADGDGDEETGLGDGDDDGGYSSGDGNVDEETASGDENDTKETGSD